MKIDNLLLLTLTRKLDGLRTTGFMRWQYRPRSVSTTIPHNFFCVVQIRRGERREHLERIQFGQTEQLIEERLKGHKYAKNITALKEHQDDTGHIFNFKESKNFKTRN